MEIVRFAAFSDDPDGGNPAGVVLDASTLTGAQMQAIAAEVGYSETAFVTDPIVAGQAMAVRFFAPEGEVDFCGHATLATAVALGEHPGPGSYVLLTKVGPVEVTAGRDGERMVGSLRSPPVSCFTLTASLKAALLACMGWTDADLDPRFPPQVGFGGNLHPVLVTRDLARLETLEYDFAALQQLCRAQNWITVQVVAATGVGQWRARNPFPWGGVVEDPATGAAAAAFAGYLQGQDALRQGDTFVITQGVEMGRPSRIVVTLSEQVALISGSAVRITRA